METEFAQSGDLAAALPPPGRLQRGARRPAACWQKPDARWIGERPGENMDGGAALCALVAQGHSLSGLQAKTKPGASLGFRRVF